MCHEAIYNPFNWYLVKFGSRKLRVVTHEIIHTRVYACTKGSILLPSRLLWTGTFSLSKRENQLLLQNLLEIAKLHTNKVYFCDPVVNWTTTWRCLEIIYTQTRRTCHLKKQINFWNLMTFLNRFLVFLGNLKEPFGRNPTKISDCEGLSHT